MVARKNEIMYNRYETLMDRQVKGKAVDTYSTLNEVLVNLCRDIMDIEQKAIVTQEFQDITNNDMHVIEAIGIGEPKNMSAIAKELSVTVGTLTIAMNSLVKKGYVFRERGKEDRRIVYISLSQRGKDAYEHHARFHKAMIDSVSEELSPEELKLLVVTLTKLNKWFHNWQKNQGGFDSYEENDCMCCRGYDGVVIGSMFTYQSKPRRCGS